MNTFSPPSPDELRSQERNVIEARRDIGQRSDEVSEAEVAEVVLYVRGGCPCPERQDALSERLRRLHGQDNIDEYSIIEWPAALNMERNVAGETGILHTVRTVEEWAQRNDLSIYPPFEKRRTHCGFTNETHHNIILPIFFLVVYSRDSISAVAPCKKGEFMLTIDTALDALESDGPEGVSSPPREP